MMMQKADCYTREGEKAGEMELPDSVFGVQINKSALYYSLKGYLANMRRGSASTKTKAEVNYSGAKPWRQKGTGRARVGSRGSAIWVGGGVAMGPKPRDYSHSVPKKVRRLALRSALTSLASEGRVVVIEDLVLEKPKTKGIVELMEKLGVLKDTRCLILIHEKSRNARLSVRNLPNAEVKVAKVISALDVVRCSKIIATKASVEQLREVFEG
jgi:large subunit ribosomal protein L4